MHFFALCYTIFDKAQFITMEFTITAQIKASAQDIYNAWLTSSGHSQMTGGDAEVTDFVDGSFTAWDGYITGKNVELQPNTLIRQTWRTSEFEDNEEDSSLEIRLSETGGITEIILTHRNLPAHGMQYKEGWKESYFDPMQVYFSDRI